MIELKAEFPAEAVEATHDLLTELEVEGWSLLQDAIQGRAWIVGLFPDESTGRQRWDELRPQLPAAPLAGPEIRPLVDQDWKDSYKAHFKAWKFGPLHWVPVWERDAFQLPPGEQVLWLDPGLAFGTGNHETTRLCVERLVGLAGGGKRRVIDAGCGSGILALSAVLLGFGHVAGFDNDSEAVRISEENAALNGLAGRVAFCTAGLDDGLAGVQADVLLANIQADVLMRFAPTLVAAVAPGGTLVLSGILAKELAQVRTAFIAAAPGWTIDSRVMGEWADLAAQRPE